MNIKQNIATFIQTQVETIISNGDNDSRLESIYSTTLTKNTKISGRRLSLVY